MHVTGITAGNPDKKDSNGEYIYGVAPEAQVMFMRVFSDRQKTTSDAIYIKAIEDAVALGADSINMSLGSATGSVVNMSPSLSAATVSYTHLELFVQHIIYSLKPDGQAAVVLPTGFITAQSGIDKAIRCV